MFRHRVSEEQTGRRGALRSSGCVDIWVGKAGPGFLLSKLISRVRLQITHFFWCVLVVFKVKIP